MELSELPAEILYNIFKHLDPESALNICEISKYLGGIVLLCCYDIEYKINMHMRYFLNCTSYTIENDFSLWAWASNKFRQKSLFPYIKENFIRCMNGKEVEITDLIYDYKLILGCKTLVLIHPTHFSFPAELEGIKHVIIVFDESNFRNMYDLTHLRSSKSVKFIHCDDYIKLDSLEHLSKVKRLYFKGCCDNITKEHNKFFRNLETLDLSYNWPVSSTEHLDNIKNLVLAHTNITDVSNLCNVKSLDISHCKNIKDFKPVANSEYLNITHCGVKDVSIFSKVKKLAICQCENPIGLDCLYTVEIERINCRYADSFY
jgi:hypothetical protein